MRPGRCEGQGHVTRCCLVADWQISHQSSPFIVAVRARLSSRAVSYRPASVVYTFLSRPREQRCLVWGRACCKPLLVTRSLGQLGTASCSLIHIGRSCCRYGIGRSWIWRPSGVTVEHKAEKRATDSRHWPPVSVRTAAHAGNGWVRTVQHLIVYRILGWL